MQGLICAILTNKLSQKSQQGGMKIGLKMNGNLFLLFFQNDSILENESNSSGVLNLFSLFSKNDHRAYHQRGYDTGKTGNLVLTFPDRENTGNNAAAQGKYFDSNY